ncbi:MAG TPA: pyruvate kinase [Pyrinomonadaceae bacterium]|nr:pyruvate kinase [Pyrinomonadaceae bacterium]HLE62417.1 pyruvate kinase [Pyrinomonadaceae bacterium]
MKRAKILVTLGPASREPATVEALLSAGADGVRINMSHGTQEEKVADILTARQAALRLNRPLAVLVDLSGPKIRTGKLAGGQPVKLEAGSLFTLTTRSATGNDEHVSTNYPDLPRVVAAGARLLLDDGAIALVVENTTETDVVCRVINGGILGERKGINLPGISLPIDSLTEKDVGDLKWAVQQRADYIALSFVRSAEDCIRAKSLIAEAGGQSPLVAKIEKAEAIDHLDAIIEAADAIMVARGDLGVETSVELVPVYQKRIIEKAVLAGKMVITATQMLQSMIANPRPTRAEASDVANAVWDGSDCLMLSNETATGLYPVPAVSTMSRIIESAEVGREIEVDRVGHLSSKQSGRVSRALCEAAMFAAAEMGTRVTAVFTQSGLMARRLSSLRPQQRIIALTDSPEVQRELALIWGVESLITEPASSTEQMLKAGEETLLRAGMVTKGEMIVVMAGRLSGLGLSSSVTLLNIGGGPVGSRNENPGNVRR